MEVQLTQAEHALLITLLQGRQRELLHEIAKADAHNFRQALQQQETLLEGLLRRLSPEVEEKTAA